MYMMSRDRLNMDLEKSSLELMLGVLSIDSQQAGGDDLDMATRQEYNRMRSKIQKMSEQMRQEGGIKNNKTLELEMQDISVNSVRIMVVTCSRINCGMGKSLARVRPDTTINP